jgi:hypothetical protein
MVKGDREMKVSGEQRRSCDEFDERPTELLDGSEWEEMLHEECVVVVVVVVVVDGYWLVPRRCA